MPTREPSYIRSVNRAGSHAFDAALLVLVGVSVTVGVSIRADPDTRPLALALGLAATAVLALRRRAPLWTLVLSGGLVLALFAFDHAAGAVAAIAPAVALYTVALVRGRIHVVLGLAAAAVAVGVADVIAAAHAHTLTLQTAAHVALVAIPVLAAEAARNRRAYVQILLERLASAEREREEEAERRAEQERLRIARELHDIVAHTLTTINVQAGVAAHLLDSEAGQARDALATIETSSHDALDELRGLLGVLRAPDYEEAPLEPAPDLAAVGALIDQAAATGLEVSFRVDGEPPDQVPEAVQLAAFRIVQESLTNARRHAPGAEARVTLAYREDRLRLTIENDTVVPVDGHRRRAGVGILGLRERTAALGGLFDAEQVGERFQVAAELPYSRSA